MKKGCIIYTTEADVERLRAIAVDHGWAIGAVYIECPAVPPERRAGLKSVRRKLADGGVEALLVPSLLFLGTTLDETVALIAKMVDAKVQLISVAEGIDSTGPEGRAWLDVVASLAGHQRAIRLEKIRSGQRRARASGTHCGRPPLAPAVVEKIALFLSNGNGIRPTSRMVAVSPSRVAAEKKSMMEAGHVF